MTSQDIAITMAPFFGVLAVMTISWIFFGIRTDDD